MNRLIQCLILSAGWLSLASGPDGRAQGLDASGPATPSSASADARLLARVDTLVQHFLKEEVDSELALAVARQIEARTDQASLTPQGATGGPPRSSDRAGMVRRMLTPGRYSALEAACDGLMHSPREEARVLAIHLLAEFAGDENVDLLARLLGSPSPQVRSRAALGMARCSPERVRPQFDVLAGMLDDKDAFCRNFALHALRRALGEKAGTMVSSQEFEGQKERILRAIKP